MTWRTCLVATLAVLVLIGCGGQGDESPPRQTASGRIPRSTSSGRGPVPHPSVENTRAWRDAGRRDCRGLTPIEAAHRFRASARRAGAHERFIELVTKPDPAVESS